MGKENNHNLLPTRKPLLTKQDYLEKYTLSIEDPEKFWSQEARSRLNWYSQWETVYSGSFQESDNRWFEGGTLNVCSNCVDRHAEADPDRIAIIWEGNDEESLSISYKELKTSVEKFSNVLKNRGVKKGDRVCIYMPMIPEAVYAMLACARIGAIHSVVFAGFSSQALASRINDAECAVVISADISRRGDKIIPLKEKLAEALQLCPIVTTTIIVQTSSETVPDLSTDIDYASAMASAYDVCEPEVMDAEDPLFVLYTSGSTGKPKGVVHTTAGYLLYASATHQYSFDYQFGDIYWCMADVGWITGHTYMVYGPLSNGATIVMYEGVPTYPTPSRTWEVVEKHKVNVLYSTPTIIRNLMSHGSDYVLQNDKSSLRILGTVGEPINPDAWEWYFKYVGEGKCPISDTWWQTETGGHALVPLPWTGVQKPGACMNPFFGIKPVLLKESGEEIIGAGKGFLAIKGPWPGMMRTLWKDYDRCVKTYFKKFPGYYLTGDWAERDEDGHYWINGRADDALNVSGHLIGTAEIESVLASHEYISESAAVGVPHKLKGESLVVFVVLSSESEKGEDLSNEIIFNIKEKIGSFAKPDTVYFVTDLPKTRSGKIMRRLLKKIGVGDISDLGDLSTLAEPEIVDVIIKEVESVH